MTTTNETDGTTPTTTATPAKTKLAAVKADTTKATPDTAPTANDATATKPAKPAKDQASYLAVALHADLRSRLDATAKAEGVSAASVIRKAISQHFAAMDNANADTAAKVDQVQAGLEATLAKLSKLDRVVEALYADTVRVADRLARATAEKA